METYLSLEESNRRLLVLAEFLDKLPPERFEYSHWIADDGSATKTSCGTSGCALGWAASMPEFQALGLEIVPSGPLSGIKYKGSSWWENYAIVRIFGTGLDDLFFPHLCEKSCEDQLDEETGRCPKYSADHNASPQYVAEKIRKFVAARGA